MAVNPNTCIDALHSLSAIQSTQTADGIPDWTAIGECPVDLIVSINYKDTALREVIRKFGGTYLVSSHHWRIEIRPNPNGMDILRRLYDGLRKINVIVAVIPVCEPKRISDVDSHFAARFSMPDALLSIAYPLANHAREIGARWDAFNKVWRKSFKSISADEQKMIDHNRAFLGLTNRDLSSYLMQSMVHADTLRTLYNKKYFQLSNRKVVVEMAFCEKNCPENGFPTEVVVITHAIRMKNNPPSGPTGFQCSVPEARRIWDRMITCGFDPTNTTGENFLKNVLY